MPGTVTILAYSGLSRRSIAILAAFEAAEREAPSTGPDDPPIGLTYEDLREWISQVDPESAKFLAGLKWNDLLISWANRAQQADRVIERQPTKGGRGPGGAYKKQEFFLTPRGRWLCRLLDGAKPPEIDI